MGSSIGSDNSTMWKVPTKESREEELKKLQDFHDSNCEQNEEHKHKLELEFIAEYGLRQLGPPRIGDFADRISPELLHLEVNSWQHVLDIMYKESVRRGIFHQFIDVLKNPPKLFDADQQPGCYISKEIEKHHSNEGNGLKRLEMRLVGSQAISLAQYRYLCYTCF